MERKGGKQGIAWTAVKSIHHVVKCVRCLQVVYYCGFLVIDLGPVLDVGIIILRNKRKE